jgi:serine/threonine protein kinase
LAFIYNIFEAVDQLHAARIILGDVNPRNILYNPATKLPVFIDLDAAQIGNFPCLTTLDLYNDPALEHGPKTLAGGYVFDTGTDIFALAVVCFEFWIGFRPHVLRRMPVRPQKGDVENKRLGISSLKCFALGRDYLSKLGVTYIDGPENQAVERRIAQLQTQDRPLYDFFVAVFVHGERENLLLSLPVKDRRHPGYRFLADPDFMAIIDAAEQKRKASAVQARQGYIKPRATADRDFVTLIDSMSTATNRPTPRKPQPRPDPAALRYFLDHFNLGV